MNQVITQSVLVILTGIYAIRASWFIFSGNFSPLTPVAAAVLIFCIVLFHRPPIEPGIWLYFVLASCIIGLIANFTLLFSTHEAYRNPANLTFSAISVVGWIAIGLGFASILFAKSNLVNQ